MRQLPPDMVKVQESINNSVDNSKIIGILLMVGNIILQAGLSSVFLMLRALQIIIIFPLLESSMPANAGIIFRKLAEIAAFDYFTIEDTVDDILDLLPTEPVNNKMETIGFESR